MRKLFILIVMWLPMAMAAQMNERDGLRLQWGASVALDINVPGSWTSGHGSGNIQPGFSVGGEMRLLWPKGWLFETGVNVGFGHNVIDPKVKGASSVVVDRWRVGVPVTGGYKFALKSGLGLAPLVGLEYNYYFATGTAGLSGVSSADLWRPCNLDWCVGAALMIDDIFEVDVKGNFGMFRANRPRYDVLYTRYFLPCRGSVTAKVYF